MWKEGSTRGIDIFFLLGGVQTNVLVDLVVLVLDGMSFG